jgi:hypothetical protein
MGCAPAAGFRFLLQNRPAFFICHIFYGVTVLRAPPVPAFYDYVKSLGGGAVDVRPFSDSKRALLLYDDDTVLDFEQVAFSLLEHRYRVILLHHHSII